MYARAHFARVHESVSAVRFHVDDFEGVLQMLAASVENEKQLDYLLAQKTHRYLDFFMVRPVRLHLLGRACVWG